MFLGIFSLFSVLLMLFESCLSQITQCFHIDLCKEADYLCTREVFSLFGGNYHEL